jgi:hypothetical protein
MRQTAQLESVAVDDRVYAVCALGELVAGTRVLCSSAAFFFFALLR